MITFDKLFQRANFAEVVSMIKENDFNGATNVENFVIKGRQCLVAFDFKGYRCKAEYILERNGRVSYLEESFAAIKQSNRVLNHEEEMRKKNDELSKYKIILRETVKILTEMK